MTFSNHLLSNRFMMFIRLSFFLLAAIFSGFAFAEETQSGFDHFSTGFPLIGRHEFIDCSDCHIAGQFKGTPMDCGICHNGIRAPGKNIGHVAESNNFCDDCHTERTWLGAKFNHNEIQKLCQECHNNVIAFGKSPSHINTSNICEDCHNTISFNHIGKIDHVSAIGACNSCHNGVIARGKTPDHIPTGVLDCNACHTVNTWLGATVPVPAP